MHSKAERIRNAFAKLGAGARSKDVIRLLAKEGESVTPQQVSNERSKLKQAGTVSLLDDLPISVIKKVKSLADELGSTQVVRRALDEIDELTRSRTDRS